VLRTRPPGHSRTAPISIRPADVGEWICVPILCAEDIAKARQRARELASTLEFSPVDRTLIASVISELGRNIVRYARPGEIRLRSEQGPGSTGVAIVARDSGPGIRDPRAALQHSASRGLGLGLPGVKRVMDEFEIASKPRHGTTVTVKKWKPL
jgi:serine/threonine-protein kinase RsbT